MNNWKNTDAANQWNLMLQDYRNIDGDTVAL